MPTGLCLSAEPSSSWMLETDGGIEEMRPTFADAGCPLQMQGARLIRTVEGRVSQGVEPVARALQLYREDREALGEETVTL